MCRKCHVCHQTTDLFGLRNYGSKEQPLCKKCSERSKEDEKCKGAIALFVFLSLFDKSAKHYQQTNAKLDDGQLRILLSLFPYGLENLLYPADPWALPGGDARSSFLFYFAEEDDFPSALERFHLCIRFVTEFVNEVCQVESVGDLTRSFRQIDDAVPYFAICLPIAEALSKHPMKAEDIGRTIDNCIEVCVLRIGLLVSTFHSRVKNDSYRGLDDSLGAAVVGVVQPLIRTFGELAKSKLLKNPERHLHSLKCNEHISEINTEGEHAVAKWKNAPSASIG